MQKRCQIQIEIVATQSAQVLRRSSKTLLAHQATGEAVGKYFTVVRRRSSGRAATKFTLGYLRARPQVVMV